MRQQWHDRLDRLVYVGLIALMITSTMNGLAFDWPVLGTEITIRPDQIALLMVAPVIVIAWGAGRYPLRLSWFDWVVLGFLASNLAASLLFSPSRSASLKGTLLLTGYAAMYFVVRHIVANRRPWLPRASNWVCGVGIAQTVYSFVALALYAAGIFIGGLQIGHLMEGSVATKGTFWEPNLFGAYLSLIALFFGVRYLFKRDTDQGAPYLAGLFAASLALPLTVTRAAGLALAAGVASLLLIACVYRREIPAWRIRVRNGAVTLFCALLVTATVMDDFASAVSGYPDFLVERWTPLAWRSAEDRAAAQGAAASGATASGATSAVRSLPFPIAGLKKSGPPSPAPAPIRDEVTRASRSSVHGRMAAWNLALQAVRERPILGHGTLSGAGLIQDGWWYGSLIQSAYDTGVLGFLALLVIQAAAVVRPLRTWRRTRAAPASANLLALGIGNAVILFVSQFSNPFFVGFPWVFLGLSMGAVEAFSDRSSASPS
jgi:O-antigen ligase